MKDLLAHLVDGRTLTTQQTIDLFDWLMSGQATPVQWGAVLSMIQMRGPTVDEIVGAAKVMRDKSVKVAPPAGLRIIDTCGTGGDHAGTFNISTGAALVAAAAARPHGAAVAKHGNRSVTSRSGSSQVLETLGVNLQATGPTLTRCLDQAGICFCFAPAHHPAMKHAAPVRAELGFRTIFNMLGPLTNPAGAVRQVVGVFDADLTPTLADALGRLGSEHAMVVHGRFGDGGLDELSTAGVSQISELRDGNVRTFELDPATLKLPAVDPAALTVDGAAASAAVLEAVLGGERHPGRDIVALNAAAALVVADVAADLADGLQRAFKAIDCGQARRALDKLVELTHAQPIPTT